MHFGLIDQFLVQKNNVSNTSSNIITICFQRSKQIKAYEPEMYEPMDPNVLLKVMIINPSLF